MSFFKKEPQKDTLIEIELDADKYLTKENGSLIKLEISDKEKEQLFSQINALKPQILSVAKTAALSDMYIVKFPKGLPQTLIELKQGGYMSFVRDKGRIVGTASLIPASAGSIAALGIFTAMSVITGQYFLANINSEMTKINDKLDIIQKTLDNSKLAELASDEEIIKSIFDGDRRPEGITELARLAYIRVNYYDVQLRDAYNKYKSKINDDNFNRVIYMCVLLKRALMVLVQCNILEVMYGKCSIDHAKSTLDKTVKSIYGEINDTLREMKGAIEQKRKSKRTMAYLQALSDLGIDSLTSELDDMNQNITTALNVAVAKELVISAKEDIYLLKNAR